MLGCYEVKSNYLDRFSLNLTTPNFIEMRSAMSWLKQDKREDLPIKPSIYKICTKNLTKID
jgi:hypothetical protein